MKLAGKIVLVTGVDPFVGRGAARFLGSQGATVYLMERRRANGGQPYYGMLHRLAETITAAGGVGIAVPYDHADDHRVRALFERIESEQGHLDIPVNNATINITASDVSFRPPFWERNLGQADEITLGLRLAYLSSYYAAPLLLWSEKALVANLSSYEYDDAAYGATKAGLDRMTWHMAQHFKVYSFKGTGI